MSKKPDDAARIAGLASILKASNKPKDPPTPPPLPREEEAAPVELPAPRSKSGEIGKYRDPRFRHCGVYLRKETHKRVKRKLEDLDSDKDLSELVEELLSQWLASFE